MHRSLPALLTASALAVLLSGCGGSDSSDASGSAASPAVPSPAVASPASTAPATPSAAASATAIQLTVSKGKISGDTGRVRIKLGTTVDIAVTDDVAEEVHIHGYDLHVDTLANQTVHKQFVANIPGVFTVELEASSTELTRLQVQ